jgi:hypothetical protein
MVVILRHSHLLLTKKNAYSYNFQNLRSTVQTYFLTCISCLRTFRYQVIREWHSCCWLQDYLMVFFMLFKQMDDDASLHDKTDGSILQQLYTKLPSRGFWRRSSSTVQPGDPRVPPPSQLNRAARWFPSPHLISSLIFVYGFVVYHIQRGLLLSFHSQNGKYQPCVKMSDEFKSPITSYLLHRNQYLNPFYQITKLIRFFWLGWLWTTG